MRVCGLTRKFLAVIIVGILLTHSGCASDKPKKARDENRGPAARYFWMALININNGETDLAEANLKKSLDLRPAHPNAWLALGKVYETKGENDEAVHAYMRAIVLDPKMSAGYIAAMKVQLKMGRPTDAALLGEQAVENGAPKVDMIGKIGWAYYVAGDLDKAEKSLRKATWLSIIDVPSMNNLGLVLFTEARYEEALSYFKLSWKQSPDSKVSPYLVAATLNKLGKTAEAAATLKAALSKDPGLEARIPEFNKAYFMHVDPGDMGPVFDEIRKKQESGR